MTGRRRRAPKEAAPPPITASPPPLTGRASARLSIAALALVVLTTLVVYWPVRGFEFVHYDDNAFILDNPRMQEGLTLRNVGWAFTVSVAANWHPLTILTHLLDCSLYHLDAGGHHFTSLLIHLANVVLLYLLLRRLSVSRGAGLLVAALFALHPINVESVAWVAERKNVLSTLFLLLALWTYVGYARTPTRRAYLVTLLLFTAGLLSKAMLVSLPVLLLLLDFWPLRRGSVASARTAARDLLRLLPEKVPFIVLSLVACLVTLQTQQQSEALTSVESFPIADRLMSAAASYVAYVGDLFFPVHLSVFYPRAATPAWQGIGAGALLIAASDVAWRQRTRRPHLAFGWLWYVVTLIPVIGLVHVGSQARADRYAYVPFIGLFLILALLAEELAGRLRVPRGAGYAVASLLAFALSIGTWGQVRVWHDTRTLFEHALRYHEGAYVAHNGLGILYARNRQFAEARKEFEAALAINPDYYDAYNNLGQIALDQNELEGAVRFYMRAITYKRNIPRTFNNLGTSLARLGRHAEALGYFEQALRLDPGYLSARNNHARVLSMLGRTDEAIAEYRKVIEVRPDDAPAYVELGLLYDQQGKRAEALPAFETALRLDPGNERARAAAEEVRRRLGASTVSP